VNNLVSQLNKYYSGTELLEQLKVLPPYRSDVNTIPERLMALLDVYKIFIPNQTTIDIYNRLYLSLINSLDKKNTLLETQLANDNFRAIKGLKRYGVIGGMESFRITGTAGLGKTSSIQRCADVITGNKILVSNQPYKEIIPILFVECVADGSFKSLLYSILQEVDTKLGTTYFLANKHQTTTVDTLLASVSNVLINHVALLVIDEIERVANDSKKGQTLINYLTQLVNQSNIAICFVGNESANKYFQMKEYMSRRTIGTSIKRMDYDETFYNFLSILFRYQYTLHKVELTAELARTFYKFTNGAPAIIVSLFVETQKYMILNGQEKLDMKSLELVFKENFNNMFIYLDKTFEEKCPKKKEPTPLQVPIQTVLPLPMEDNLFARVFKESNKNITRALAMLNDYTNVEFI
jgi:nucleoside-triphosphatase THEP1